MEIRTNRRFKIKPKTDLCIVEACTDKFNEKRIYSIDIGREEMTASGSIFETDGLTYSRLKSVTLDNNNKGFSCKVEYFDIIEEIF